MQHELLQTDLTLNEAGRLQEKYSQKLKHQEHKTLDTSDIKEINWVVGVDVSYYKERHEEWGEACAVLWNFHLNKMDYNCFAKGIITFPYKPGFLGFRECNLLVKAIEKLPETPDIIMCDAHGIIHPRRFGEAVQLGLILNIPTFGVAKNPFIGFSEWKTLVRKKGNKKPIWADDPQNSMIVNQELLGYAVCLKDIMKPMFISVGYKITLDVALEIALKTTKDHKQPEPLYLADYLLRKKI
ncbi:MAG: endonuclease V [Candidatus Lokiarchaeota archaeon]|nr:endonuclease V [Candidatus Lokiarchaeota archaeon]